MTTARIFNGNTNSEPEAKPLYGTVPSHRSYIFLRSSEPPSTFPARIFTPIQRALLLKVMKWGGIVNFSWNDSDNQLSQSLASDHTSATAFSISGGRLEIPEVSLDNVDEVAELLRKHADGPLEKNTADEIHLYVCTHGARDCRCGNIGGEVVRALLDEVKKRVRMDPLGLASRIKVCEAAHVGGHDYAANLLVYPHGEWLGLLTPEDVPSVLSSILKHTPLPFDANRPPLHPERWRGRMGLTKDEQRQLYMALAPSC